MKQSLKAIITMTFFSLCAGLILTTTAQAATFTVTTTANNGAGSLREAIFNANNQTGDDTINFAIPATDAGCVSGVCTITLTSGELVIQSPTTTENLTITNADGANSVVISGNNTSRVFLVYSSLTLDSLTVTRGNGGSAASNGLGGGIVNLNTLTVNNCTISNNAATNGQSGGGIAVPDNLNAVTTINNSTVSGNTTTLLGGGLRNGLTATMTVNNSTITNNTSSGANGGGIRNSGGTLNLTNTIVAGNTNATSPDVSSTGTVTASYNLIGTNGGNTIANGTNGNQVGTNAAPLNPLLAPLADNGGKTQTHALQTGSPAIDKGRTQGTPGIAQTLSNTSDLTKKGFSATTFAPTATRDQRGRLRPYDDPAIANAAGGDGADIGAFEALAATAANVSITGRALTADGRGITNATVTIYGSTLTAPRTVRTSSFGYYRFDDLAAGQTYVLEIRGKRYSFTNPTRVVSLNEDLAEENFIAEP